MPKKYLVIVEAPGKVAKVKSYLNKADPKNEYLVEASVGHVMDLAKDNMSIDLDTFTPHYKVSDDKKDIVKKLKKARDICDDVILATDPDTEGCAIAWGIAHALKLDNPKRILYNKIDEEAIKEALKNKIPIDMDLFHSQQARRMLDRIIGYMISPILWKVLQGAKSSGRVQSVVVRLICEKEDEINNFFEKDQSSYFKTTADFNNKYKGQLYTSKKQAKNDDDDDGDDDNNEKKENNNGKLQIAKVIKQKEMKNILMDINKSNFIVSNITERESIRNPPAPYTTDTLITDAHGKIGFTTQRTTAAAQALYLGGHITYIRTDSPNIAESALEEIGKMVVDNFGKKYHRQQQYKAKKGNAQCAHECIRPTHIENMEIPAKDKCTNDERMLYKLIWKRTMASQMSPAKFNINNVEIDISKLEDYKFVLEHEVCCFDGFLAVYNPDKKEDDDDDNKDNDNDNDNDNDKKKKVSKDKLVLPKKGDKLEISNVISSEEYKKPPPRYDDGSIISKMKKIGIGRPSTYNSIIKKIQDVNYVKIQNNGGVEKICSIFKLIGGKLEEETKTILLGKDNRKCVPTEMGKAVNQFLIKNFTDIMDYQFTANMEELLDIIEDGKLSHIKMLQDFYGNFKPLVDQINNKAEGGVISLKDMKEIGKHPESGHKIYTLMAKFGPIVQMLDEKNKIINTAPIKEPLKINTITVNDAVKLFEYPKLLGKYGKKNISLYKGQYGFYLKYGDEKIGLKINENEADNYSLENAIEKIDENNKKFLWTGKDKEYNYTVMVGPYGKFISMQPIKKTNTKKQKNFKFPPNQDINKLTVDIINEIIKNSYSNRFKKKEKVEKENKKEKVEKENKKEKVKKEDKKEIKPKKITKKVKSELDDVFGLKKKPVKKK